MKLIVANELHLADPIDAAPIEQSYHRPRLVHHGLVEPNNHVTAPQSCDKGRARLQWTVDEFSAAPLSPALSFITTKGSEL